MAQSQAQRDTITYHNGEPAVNVRDHHLYARDPQYADSIAQLTDGEWQAIYDDTTWWFWHIAAQDIATDYAYGDIYSDGRSDGWLHVQHIPDLDLLGDEPDDADANAVTQWLAFAQRIEQLIDDSRDDLLQALTARVAANQLDADETAAWAVRDVITVGD